MFSLLTLLVLLLCVSQTLHSHSVYPVWDSRSLLWLTWPINILCRAGLPFLLLPSALPLASSGQAQVSALELRYLSPTTPGQLSPSQDHDEEVPCRSVVCFTEFVCLVTHCASSPQHASPAGSYSVTARNLRRNITWAFLRAVKGDLNHTDKKGPLFLCCIYKQTSTCDRFALQFICKWACRRKGDSHGTWQEVLVSKAKLWMHVSPIAVGSNTLPFGKSPSLWFLLIFSCPSTNDNMC